MEDREWLCTDSNGRRAGEVTGVCRRDPGIRFQPAATKEYQKKVTAHPREDRVGMLP